MVTVKLSTDFSQVFPSTDNFTLPSNHIRAALCFDIGNQQDGYRSRVTCLAILPLLHQKVISQIGVCESSLRERRRIQLVESASHVFPRITCG